MRLLILLDKLLALQKVEEMFAKTVSAHRLVWPQADRTHTPQHAPHITHPHITHPHITHTQPPPPTHTPPTPTPPHTHTHPITRATNSLHTNHLFLFVYVYLGSGKGSAIFTVQCTLYIQCTLCTVHIFTGDSNWVSLNLNVFHQVWKLIVMAFVLGLFSNFYKWFDEILERCRLEKDLLKKNIF